jgi:hypothetical protein
MNFGLCNAPATFQSYINSILNEYLDRFCTPYMDDVLIYSKNLQEHKRHVRLVIEALDNAGLKLDIDKCEFYKKEVKFLGLIISPDGIRMDPAKIQCIKDWAYPTSVRDIQVFLGFCNFYRRFIRDYSQKARPLHKLITKGAL